MSNNVNFSKMTMGDFNSFYENKEPQIMYQNEAMLIPTTKIGSEGTLTSVFLKSLCLIKEFRELIFKDINTKTYTRCKIHAFTEVAFPEAKNGKTKTDKSGLSRIDGLLLVERKNLIVESIFFEMKNGPISSPSNCINIDQIKRYRALADELKITKFVTVSNQYVTMPSQLPINLKKEGIVEMYHLSWPLIMSKASVLLYENDINIEDEDQVNIMKEVVRYFRNPKSGVTEYNSMCTDWKVVMSYIFNDVSFNNLNIDKEKQIDHTVDSWIQEEKDLAIRLSTRLGAFVNIKTGKGLNTTKKRQDAIREQLCKKGIFESEFIIPNIVSTLKVIADCNKQSINIHITISDKKSINASQQIRYIKKQLTKCMKKTDLDGEYKSYVDVWKNLFLYINIKNSSRIEIPPLTNIIKRDEINNDCINEIIESYKNEKIRNIGIAMHKNFGKEFYSSSKFVKLYEAMVINFYKNIIAHVENQQAPTPKLDIVINEKTETAN